MRQSIGKDAEKRAVAILTVEPFQGFAVNHVGRILRTLFITVAIHGILDVFLHCHTHDSRVACRLAVAVQEIRIIQVCLKLADISIELVNATFVGRRNRPFVAAGPLAEHAGSIAVILHNLRQNHMVGVVWMLTDNGIILIFAIHHCRHIFPIFFIAAHFTMSAVLTSHKSGTRRSTYRTAGISLGETHSLLCHPVDVRCLNIGLSIATEVAVTHIVAHYIYYIGLFRRHSCRCSRKQKSRQRQGHHIIFHSFVSFCF